jgi:hypothetical protein
MGSTDEPNRFQHTRVLGVDDVVANTGEGGVAAIGRTAGWRWKLLSFFDSALGPRMVTTSPLDKTSPQSLPVLPRRDSTN